MPVRSVVHLAIGLGGVMDPITHLVATRLVLGRDRSALIASVIPDAPFYLAYPPWLVRKGMLRDAVQTGTWPEPPHWLLRAHRSTHSLLIVLITGAVVRCVMGRWPLRVVLAWLLHILIDVPTHRREPWGPRPLWPLSAAAFEGWSWGDALSQWYAHTLTQRHV
jgi:hypothetical protein